MMTNDDAMVSLKMEPSAALFHRLSKDAPSSKTRCQLSTMIVMVKGNNATPHLKIDLRTALFDRLSKEVTSLKLVMGAGRRGSNSPSSGTNMTADLLS